MRKMLIGVIMVLLLSVAIPVTAETINRQLKATERNDYSVVINGTEVVLKNPPIIVDGSSYLPVRELAELVGSEVTFVDGVITLTTPNEQVPQERFAALIEQLETTKKNADRIIKSLEERDDLSEDAIATAEWALENYNKRIDDLERQIAELKAKYPELNE